MADACIPSAQVDDVVDATAKVREHRVQIAGLVAVNSAFRLAESIQADVLKANKIVSILQLVYLFENKNNDVSKNTNTNHFSMPQK